MSAGSKFEFLWCDGDKFKKPAKLTASEYCRHVLEWVQSQIDDEAVFPTLMGISFGKKFPAVVKLIFKRISRVYAHLYHHHYPAFQEAGIDTLLNTSFKHFVFFAREFQLILEKDLLPLEPMLREMDKETRH
ncbi:MOB kinase activator 1B [Kappamyces sp. JEL0680]|nr:MOB kinase activator 1B [Kappamyces sp. JEL0680]